MKTRKQVLNATLVGALLLGSLAACGKNDAGSGASEPSKDKVKQEKIRVVTFFAGSDQWAPVWKEVIADYMVKNPNITIVDESQPTSGANDLFKTKVQADIAANNPADVMLYYAGANYTNTIAESGQFVDLQPYLDADAEWAKHFKASPLESMKYEGKQYSLPYIGYYEGMFYNKALFDKFNLQEPTTWNNLMTAVETFSKNDIVSLAVSLATPYITTESFILAQSGQENHKNYFDDSWAPALDAIAELHKKGGLPKDAMILTEDDIRLQFKEGKAAMMINGSWVLESLQENPDMRIIPLPAPEGGKGGEHTVIAGYGSGWHLSKEASERSDESLKLLKYLTSPEIMARFIAKGGSPAIEVKVPEGSSPLMKSAIEMLNKSTYQDNALDSQVNHDAYETMNLGLQYLVEGKKTSLEILEEARKLNQSK